MRPFLLAAVLLASAGTAAAPSLGPFERQADIGAPKRPGSAVYRDGRFALTAGGYNIARAHDEFHFVWRKVKGDFAIEGRVLFTGPGVTPHRKAGLMARADLGDAAAHIDATVHGDGPRAVVVRRGAGEPTEVVELDARTAPSASASPASLPAAAKFVRLERHGDSFTILLREAGKPDAQRTVDLALPDELYLGLFLSAHNAEVTESATIDQVRLTAH